MSVIEQETVEAPVELDDVGRHLVRAADYIERHGWCQGVVTDGVRVCMAGAIAFTSTNRGDRRAYARMREQLCMGIGEWNDSPVRTKEEVIESLERAAYGL